MDHPLETVRTNGAIVPGQTARLAAHIGAPVTCISPAILGVLDHVVTFGTVTVDKECLMNRQIIKCWFTKKEKSKICATRRKCGV